MSRQHDTLELLACDLESRYGQDDALVLEVKAEIKQRPKRQTVDFTVQLSNLQHAAIVRQIRSEFNVERY